MANNWILPLSVITLLTILVSPTLGNCSIAITESPPFMELAEQADLILIGKVINIEVREKDTITVFQVSEYIKDWKSSPEFTLKQRGGTNLVVMPASPTFNAGDEHLLFLMEKNEINLMNDEKSYYLLFDHFGKPLLENVVRELYGSTDIGEVGGKELAYSSVYLLIAVLSLIAIIGIIYGRTRFTFH